ncbi:MAG: 2-C-methyl-D-erythritol 4-phosphate cytidylyltransferase [bacterium]
MKAVIIVAGGTGTRMNPLVPKQFIVLAGKPMLLHTIEAFLGFDKGIRIIVAIPDSLFREWHHLIGQYSFQVPHTLVPGGSTRFHSVKNGLDALEQEELVAVHDGVRPLASVELIGRAFSEAEIHGTAIPVIPLSESIRFVEGPTNHPVDRTAYRIVQTPQVFRTSLLKQAYLQDFRETFTDDATVVESTGQPIHLIDGDPANIKITRPADLILATSLLKSVAPSI